MQPVHEIGAFLTGIKQTFKLDEANLISEGLQVAVLSYTVMREHAPRLYRPIALALATTFTLLWCP